EIASASSIVAAIPQVRAALLDRQRDFADNPPRGAPGAVLDGRDIGTVVRPNAQVKLFVTARPDVRARRRFLERSAADPSADEEAVRDELAARDARDQAREAAPLKPAADAHLLDTSDLSIEAALNAARSVVDQALGSI
ncbi:MAG: (d)CMP kinase, partial [Pseudomonadota bacterium]